MALIASKFAMKDSGALSYFLGINVVTKHVGGLFLSQSTYASDIIARAGMASCKPSATPVDTKQKLSTTADTSWSHLLSVSCRGLPVSYFHTAWHLRSLMLSSKCVFTCMPLALTTCLPSNASCVMFRAPYTMVCISIHPLLRNLSSILMLIRVDVLTPVVLPLAIVRFLVTTSYPSLPNDNPHFLTPA